MKILLIHNKYLPIYNIKNKGAIEKLVRLYLEYNESKEDGFTVYSPKISSEDYDSKELKNTEFRNVDLTATDFLLKIEKLYYSLRRRLTFSGLNRRYISKIIKDIKQRNEQNAYDLIIFENEEQDIPYFRKKMHTKTKIVEHLHNDYINKDVANSEIIINSCDQIWTVSNFLAERINTVKSANIATIPNTIKLSSLSPNQIIVKQLEEKYNSKKNKIFLYVGRLLKVKGITQLLEAFSKYNKVDPDSKLLLIGATEDNKEGESLKEIINKYVELNGDIHLIGFVDPRDLINYQRIADCQVIPSMWEEAFGLVVLEAMSANLKIIASRSGGIPEIGKTKILYVERDNIVNDLVEAFGKIKKEKLPKNYYKEILETYSEEHYYDNLYNAIHEKK